MIYNLIKVFFSSFLLTQPINFIPLLLISLTLFYFIYITIPLINRIKLNKKEITNLVKTAFSLGIKKSLILSYFVIAILTTISLLLIFYFIELNLILLFFSLILFLLIFVWSKIYFAIVIKKLSSI